MSWPGELEHRIGIVGAGAVHALGAHWRGLASELPSAARAALDAPSRAPRWAPPPIALPPDRDVQDRRALRVMAPATRLAAIAIRDALAEAAWQGDRSAVGYGFGVGGGGSPLAELEAMLSASQDGGRFSLARFAEQGLAAANPLLAFHLLNNYVHCHPAVGERLGGAARGFFSRGAGTVVALDEAAWSLADQEVLLAITGGADSASSPGAWLELERGGLLDAGMVPAEGAAAFVLGRFSIDPCVAEQASGVVTTCSPAAQLRPALAWIEATAIDRGAVRTSREREPGALDRLDSRLERLASALAVDTIDVAVAAAWGAPARDSVLAWLRRASRAVVLDSTAVLGDALAATPALALAAALDAVAGSTRRALAVGIDVDDALWAVVVRGAS